MIHDQQYLCLWESDRDHQQSEGTPDPLHRRLVYLLAIRPRILKSVDLKPSFVVEEKNFAIPGDSAEASSDPLLVPAETNRCISASFKELSLSCIAMCAAALSISSRISTICRSRVATYVDPSLDFLFHGPVDFAELAKQQAHRLVFREEYSYGSRFQRVDQILQYSKPSRGLPIQQVEERLGRRLLLVSNSAHPRVPDLLDLPCCGRSQSRTSPVARPRGPNPRH